MKGVETEHAAYLKETVVLQYFAWHDCNKLHFGDIVRKEEKG